MGDALVIIPTYNERENLPRIVPAVLEQDARLDVLVVDDASPDGTGKLADEMAAQESRLHVLHRTGKMGLGGAYLAGFRYAIEHGYALAFEMDADFSHDPRHVSEFLDLIPDFDVVVGSRYTRGVTVVNWPMGRLLLSYLANKYARWVTGLPFNDLTSGFKCYRRPVLEMLDRAGIHSNGYGFQIETTFHSWHAGFRIAELPIVFVDRNVGVSKMNKRIIWEAVWMVWRMRWWAITGRVRRVAPAAAIGKSENQARAAPDVSRPERLAEGHE
jgi:dolichol-phosphate mannosyltransferase